MSEWNVVRGDCLDTLKGLPDASVDSFVTDLPYGISLVPQRGRTKAIANDGRPHAKALWWGVCREAARLAKPNTAHIFFSGWSEVWAKDVLAEWFTVKGCIVWRKNVWGMGYYLRPQWELAWYCHSGEPPLPEKAPSDVWDVARVHEPAHSCEKPVELMRRAVDFVCPPDGYVVDPCCGIGATGIACVQTGRRFLGVELDEGYAATARRRIADAVPLFAGAA